MQRRLVLIGFLACLALSPVARAAIGVQGAVGNISEAQAAELMDVACRTWSTSDPVVNANQRGINSTCVDVRCPRTYRKNPMLEPGGYICPGEDTIAYASDADNQTFYLLIDAQTSGSACNHAAFYSVQGLVARSDSPVTGDFRQTGCPGTAAVNCFERVDSRSAKKAATTLAAASKEAGARSISSIGGLSPVPVVRASLPGDGCPDGQARLMWDEPETYASTMKNSTASPVKGVRLYTNSASCGSCPDATRGWTAKDSYPLGAGSKGVCVPVEGPTWFALSVRLTGPNATKESTSEVETGHVKGAGFVGPNSACIQPVKR